MVKARRSRTVPSLKKKKREREEEKKRTPPMVEKKTEFREKETSSKNQVSGPCLWTDETLFLLKKRESKSTILWPRMERGRHSLGVTTSPVPTPHHVE